MKKLTTSEFIKKAVAVHGGKFDYSKTVYANTRTKVGIICREHGSFQQTPGNHLSGVGCMQCVVSDRADSQRCSPEEFIKKAITIHGDKYDYSRVMYSNNKTKVEILCPEHGPFLQAPGKHLIGRGCSGCSDNGFDPDKCKTVYVFSSDDGMYMKVGVTKDIRGRSRALRNSTPFLINHVLDFEVDDGYVALAVEKALLTWGVSCNFTGFNGATEWVLYDEKILCFIKTYLEGVHYDDR